MERGKAAKLLFVWEVSKEVTSVAIDEGMKAVYVGRFDRQAPIQKFTYEGRPLGFISGYPSFWAPRLAVDSRRGLLLAAPERTIRTFDRHGNQLSTIRCPEFQKLDDITYDVRHDRYIVVDKKARCIMFVDPKSEAVVRAIVAGRGDEMLLENNQVCVASNKFGQNPSLVTVDASSSTIRLFDGHGRPLAAYRDEGDGPGQFSLPMGVCFSPDSQIVVSDSFNDRLVCLRHGTSRGRDQWRVMMETTDHTLANPRSVDITRSGLMVVAFWAVAEGPFRVAMFSTK